MDVLIVTDSLKIKLQCFHLLLLVMTEENSLTVDLQQSQLDMLSYLIRFNILHVNSFNSGYLDIADLFDPTKCLDDAVHHFEFFENSFSTNPITSLSTKPVL